MSHREASADPPRLGVHRTVGAVVFDLFGTLTDGALERERAGLLRALAELVGAPPSAFVAAMRASFDDRAKGRTGDVADTLKEVCRRAGTVPMPHTIEQGVAYRLEIERRLASPRPDAVGALARLRALGVRIGVVSDCGAETSAVWASLAYAPLVDSVTFSCTVGCRKPHPAIYMHAARNLGVAPSRCLYVGDGGSRELSGAAAVGMRAVLLRIAGEDDYPELRYDAEQGWSGEVVTSLGAVLALVDPRAPKSPSAHREAAASQPAPT